MLRRAGLPSYFLHISHLLPWWLSGKESACQCRFNPWVGKIPWRRKWQPTLVVLTGESQGQRSLVGYSSCCCSVGKSSPTLCDPTDCSTPSPPPVLHYLPEFVQIHVHWVGNAIQPSHPVSPFPPALKLSQHQGLPNESALLIRWPKYWSFSFSNSPSKEYLGLISFRIVWFDLLSVQGTLKNLLQHHNAKALTLQCSAFFMVQLSHPYMTTGKTIAFTRWIFVGKVISLLFNMLSRFVVAFFPRSKNLLISWLQSLPAVTLKPKKVISVLVFTFSLCICHEVMGSDAMILDFWMLSFKSAFSLSSSIFIKRLFISSSLSLSFSLCAIRVLHLHIWSYCHFS